MAIASFDHAIGHDICVEVPCKAHTGSNFRLEDADSLGGPDKRVGLDIDLPLQLNRQSAGELAVRRLPYDHTRDSGEAHSRAVERFLLPASLAQQLKSTADEAGRSLYVTFIAATAILLQRYSGQDEIVVGGLDVDEAGPLAIRIDLSDDPSFELLRSRVSTAYLAAAAREVESLTSSGVLNVEVLPAFPRSYDASCSNSAAAELSKSNSAAELSFFFQDRGEEIWGAIDYDADLFDQTTIAGMARHWQNLLTAACAEPAKPISTLQILDAEETKRIVQEWNETSSDYPKQCIHELFERQVAATPDSIAVVCQGTTLTYRTLNERANQLAHYLRGRGVGPEVLIGVCMNRTPEMVIGLLGIWKAGGAYVPLDPSYPRERLSFMLQDSAAKFLLTSDDLKDLFPAASEKTICLDSHWDAIAKENICNPESSASPWNLAYVMYTSGSTGEPKGAMVLHQGLANYLTWAIQAYGVEAGGSVPVHSSISFDLTVTSMYPALLAGGCIELLPEDVGAQSLLAALRRGSRNLVKITPAHLEMLSQEIKPEEAANMTKVFVIGGENLPAESLSLWRDFAPNTLLINEYGPTETVVGCCTYEVRACDPRSGSVIIGRPIANTQLYIFDRHMNPVPPGVAGELYIGGDGVALGYLNRPELTRQKFLADKFSSREGALLYRTGDLARYRKDGMLEFLGRVDTQVKVRGYRVELGEIEAALMERPGVKMCAVLAREDEPGDKQLVAYAVPGELGKLNAEELRESLLRKLPKYMVPSHFVLLDSLPLTTNGKVDRKALPPPTARRTESDETAVAPEFIDELFADASNRNVAGLAGRGCRPRTETEKAIAAIWTEVMRVENPGIHDDFFELGGHSLLAIKIISRIRDVFDVDLPTQSLFEQPTIAGLAASLARLKNANGNARSIERRKSVGPSALSFGQEQLWFLHEMAPRSPVYNVVDMIRLGGRYNAEALRKTLQELVRRHEVLRTVFRFEGARPVQEVLTDVALAFKEIDLSSLREKDREQEWRQVVEEETRKPFDLTRAPLFRVAMVHLSAKEHKLLLTIHHIIADEWSMELIHHEFATIFEAFSHGRPSPLPELPVQYVDFAAWQREWIQSEVLDRQVAYWKKELAGAPFVLELPTDKARPAVQSFRGATEIFQLPAELFEQLKSMGREQQVTLFMVLEAAFTALLHRYTGQDDILVGTPISGRTHSEIENLIGDFLNTLVLRARFSERMSFRSLLQQVRERALGAYAHSDMSFDRLVAELSPERDASHSPLFQVMFILHNAEGVSEVSKVSGNQEFSTGTSKFDLTLVLSETSNGLAGLFEYSTDLFEAERIRRMTGHFRTLLEAIVHDPDQAISKLPMLTEPERSQLVTEWNNTTVVHPGKKACLHQLFERQAARTPDKVALVFDGHEMTYQELDARANALANHLRGLGVGPDALVGLLAERSLDMVVGLLGILKAGGAYVPLDPSFPASRLSYMAEDSKMKVLVTHRGLEENLAARPSTIVRLDSEWSEITKSAATSTKPVALSENNLAYVLYTSGSTGKPKGVAIAHSAIVNFVLSMQKEPGFTEADTLLAVTTLSFDIAGLELYLPLIAGGRVVIASREDAHDPARLQERINQSRCSVMQATPATWRALIHSGWRGSPNLKILCGGEALPRELANELLARCGELWNMYGPTETTVWSTVKRVQPGEGPVSIGRPIANTQVYVLDKNRNLVPRGAVSELYIAGDGLARGYLHRDELTRERFVPNPFVRNALMYRTGDLARWLPDGTVECLGRGDNQVKIRGFRIELGEVESALATHPGVRQCVVVAREDVPGDKLLAAYFVPRDITASPAATDLRAHLRSALPDYMIPSAFVAIERFPLTPNGKIDRKALPKPDEQRVDSPPESLVARDALDQILMQIWSKILRLKHVGIRDNFFELGGHSLAAVQMMAEIKNQTGKTLPLATLFHAATIEALGDILRKDGWKPSWSSLVPIRPQGSKPPLFLIHGAEGNVLLYRQVTQYLGKDQPVYGLQSQGLNGNDAIFTTFQEMAAAYIKEIKTVQPQGPYNFGGYCLGGVVALEMARQLTDAGEKVDRVIMLESYNLKTLSMPKFHLLAPLRFVQNVWFHLANLFAVRLEDRRKFLSEKMDTAIARLGIRLRASLRSFREIGCDRAQEAFPHLKVKKVNDQAAFDYVPQPYDGRVVLIRPKGYFVGQRSYGLGWDGVIRRELEVHELPVYPKGILVEPFCRQLAETLNLSLSNE